MGSHERLLVTPLARPALFLGRSLKEFAPLILQAVVLVVAMMPFGFRPHPVGAVLGLVLLSVMGVGIGSLSYALVLAVKENHWIFWTVNQTVIFPLMTILVTQLLGARPCTHTGPVSCRAALRRRGRRRRPHGRRLTAPRLRRGAGRAPHHVRRGGGRGPGERPRPGRPRRIRRCREGQCAGRLGHHECAGSAGEELSQLVKLEPLAFMANTLERADKVRTLSGVLGDPVEFVHLTERQERQRLQAYRFAEEYVEFGLALALDPPEVAGTVLDAVERATGRPARTYRQWVEENRDAFTATGNAGLRPIA